MIENIRKRLNDKLKDIVLNLSEEELLFAESFKNYSPIEKLIEIFSDTDSVRKLKSITSSFLNYNEIQEEFKRKNNELFTRLFFIENQIIYQKLIKKFFKKDDFIKDFLGYKQLKENSVNELLNINGKKFEILDRDVKIFKNPYSQITFAFNFTLNENSKIVKDVKIEDRQFLSHVKVNQFEIIKDLISYNDQQISNLKNKYSLSEILDLETEYVIYHELAHAAISKKITNKSQSETFSDICGLLSVIKNNDLNQEDSINFINRIIGFRAATNTITSEIEFSDIAIHSTQSHLSVLKQWVKEDFEFIKKSTKEEEVVIAEDLASLNLDNLIDLGIKNESAIFTIIIEWKKALNKSEEEVNEAFDSLNNKKLNSKNIADLFFSLHYLNNDFEKMYNFYPLSSLKSKLIYSSLKEKINLYKEDIVKKYSIIEDFKILTNDKLTKINKLRI